MGATWAGVPAVWAARRTSAHTRDHTLQRGEKKQHTHTPLRPRKNNIARLQTLSRSLSKNLPTPIWGGGGGGGGGGGCGRFLRVMGNSSNLWIHKTFSFETSQAGVEIVISPFPPLSLYLQIWGFRRHMRRKVWIAVCIRGRRFRLWSVKRVVKKSKMLQLKSFFGQSVCREVIFRFMLNGFMQKFLHLRQEKKKIFSVKSSIVLFLESNRSIF